MRQKQLRGFGTGPTPLTTLSGSDRLAGMMAGWWEGRSLAAIAAEYGVSRQRVAVLLARVGCTRALWCRADHDRLDSPRRAVAPVVEQAREAMHHPLACRLTVRQRAALAWQSQGLVLVDIARRMVTSPQNVRNLQVAALQRLALDTPRPPKADPSRRDGTALPRAACPGLARLSRAKPEKCRPTEPTEASDTVSTDNDAGMNIDWRKLTSALSGVCDRGDD